MARRVFFSFQYKPDILRVSQVRNSWRIRNEKETQPFVDAAEWESIKAKGDAEVEKWIKTQMQGTSVLVVLIGSTTYDSKWVKFEIAEAYRQKKGILAVYINKVKHPKTGGSPKGKNPLLHWSVKKDGKDVVFTELYNTYDYVDDEGYINLTDWIEDAAKAAGR